MKNITDDVVKINFGPNRISDKYKDKLFEITSTKNIDEITLSEVESDRLGGFYVKPNKTYYKIKYNSSSRLIFKRPNTNQYNGYDLYQNDDGETYTLKRPEAGQKNGKISLVSYVLKPEECIETLYINEAEPIAKTSSLNSHAVNNPRKISSSEESLSSHCFSIDSVEDDESLRTEFPLNSILGTIGFVKKQVQEIGEKIDRFNTVGQQLIEGKEAFEANINVIVERADGQITEYKEKLEELEISHASAGIDHTRLKEKLIELNNTINLLEVASVTVDNFSQAKLALENRIQGLVGSNQGFSQELGALKEHKEEITQKIQDLSAQYTELESLFTSNSSKIQENNNQNQETFNRIDRNLAENKRRLEDLSAVLDASNAKITTVEKLMSANQRLMDAQSQQLKTLQDQYGAFTSTINGVSDRITRIYSGLAVSDERANAQDFALKTQGEALSAKIADANRCLEERIDETDAETKRLDFQINANHLALNTEIASVKTMLSKEFDSKITKIFKVLKSAISLSEILMSEVEQLKQNVEKHQGAIETFDHIHNVQESRLNVHDTRIDELNNEIEKVDAAEEENKSKIEVLTTRLEASEDSIQALDDNVQSEIRKVNQKVKEHNNRLDILDIATESANVDYNRLNEYFNKVKSELESKIKDQANEATHLNSTLEALKTQKETITSNIEDLNAQYTELESLVTSNLSEIQKDNWQNQERLNRELAENKESLENLENVLAAATAKIKTVEELMSANQELMNVQSQQLKILQNQYDTFTSAINGVSDRINGVDRRINGLDERANAQDFAVKKQDEALRTEIATAKSALEKQISAINSETTRLDSKIDANYLALGTEIALVKRALSEEFEAKIKQISEVFQTTVSKIETLEGESNDQEIRLDDHDARIAYLNKKIAEVDAAEKANKARIDELTTQLVASEKSILILQDSVSDSDKRAKRTLDTQKMTNLALTMAIQKLADQSQDNTALLDALNDEFVRLSRRQEDLESQHRALGDYVGSEIREVNRKVNLVSESFTDFARQQVNILDHFNNEFVVVRSEVAAQEVRLTDKIESGIERQNRNNNALNAKFEALDRQLAEQIAKQSRDQASAQQTIDALIAHFEQVQLDNNRVHAELRERGEILLGRNRALEDRVTELEEDVEHLEEQIIPVPVAPVPVVPAQAPARVLFNQLKEKLNQAKGYIKEKIVPILIGSFIFAAALYTVFRGGLPANPAPTPRPGPGVVPGAVPPMPAVGVVSISPERQAALYKVLNFAQTDGHPTVIAENDIDSHYVGMEQDIRNTGLSKSELTPLLNYARQMNVDGLLPIPGQHAFDVLKASGQIQDGPRRAVLR